jgi:predicted transcriptional regulator
VTDLAVEAAADARAEADVRAGRLIDHNTVKRWIASWKNPLPLRCPKAEHFN